jgi:hypothetical protein
MKEDTSAYKNVQCCGSVYENTEWLFYGFISHVDPTRLQLAATYIERPQLRPLVVGYKPHGRAQGHMRGPRHHDQYRTEIVALRRDRISVDHCSTLAIGRELEVPAVAVESRWCVLWQWVQVVRYPLMIEGMTPSVDE